MNEVILTKGELAKRQKRSVSSITTACSRNPGSIPPFFRLGTNRNSPIRFRLSDVIAWEEALVEHQRKQLSELKLSIKPRWEV
jgi:hypothetical protein